jgi:hypothetical protein
MVNFKKILTNLKDFAESDLPLDLMLIAVKDSEADFKIRVFNSEKGTKDIKGKGLGGYSNAYAEVRSDKRRQSKVKDLEFNGSLRRSLETIRSDDKIILYSASKTEQDKAINLEEMHRSKIFSLSEQEKEDTYNRVEKLITNEIKQILKDGINQ